MTKSGRHSKNHGSLAGGISRGFAARDGSAVKSHSNILQRLRRQISLDYYTIPPATQASETAVHGCHCPVDMVVRMRRVAIPYHGFTTDLVTCA